MHLEGRQIVTLGFKINTHKSYVELYIYSKKTLLILHQRYLDEALLASRMIPANDDEERDLFIHTFTSNKVI